MLKNKGVVRTMLDVRSHGDNRRRVDAYVVEYPHPDGGPWYCTFEVPRGSKFTPRDFESQKEANAARGYTT